MPLDRRLREGMSRLTADVDPDVDRILQTSVRVARRRIIVRRASVVLQAAAVLALVVVAGPRLLDMLSTSGTPADRPTPSHVDGPQAIAGTYPIEVSGGPAVVDDQGLAGTWTLQLQEDGSIDVTAPASFAGSVQGYSFDVDGNVLRTDAFVNDLCNEAQGAGVPVGTYRWELIGRDLVLDATDDACPGRVAILDGILRAAG
jgi:hypothetical protein